MGAALKPVFLPFPNPSNRQGIFLPNSAKINCLRLFISTFKFLDDCNRKLIETVSATFLSFAETLNFERIKLISFVKKPIR